MSVFRQKTRQNGTIPGMRPFPREKTKPIKEMNAEELRKLKQSNDMILRTMTAGTSAVITRLEENQAKITARLAELENLETLRRGMRRATIDERMDHDDAMAVDSDDGDHKPATSDPYLSRTVLVKQQAIAAWGESSMIPGRGKIKRMNPEQAIALEEQQNRLERERLERARARQERLAMPKRLDDAGQPMMSREEYEAKVWAFMTYKPTDSDIEADDDDDEDEDPATWFDDDQDDGIKGQDIIYPDAEDLTDVIRVDYSKILDYEPCDEGD